MATALLGGSVAPAMAAPAANGPGVFTTNGDRAHISSTPAHGVRPCLVDPRQRRRHQGQGHIWLQMKSGQTWHSVAKNAKNLKSGNGGSAGRVVARKKCANQNKRQWRTVIDVDLIGVADSPEKAYTKPVTVKCGV